MIASINFRGGGWGPPPSPPNLPRCARTGEARPPATRFRALLLLPLVAVLGCAHAPKTRPYPPPDVEALTGALTARQQAVQGMNARVRATSWLGGNRVRATVNMLVLRDGHLRFEAEVSLQGTVATLATDGALFSLLDVRKNEMSRGPACPANIASLVRIPLSPADIAAVLLGDVRLPAAATPETMSVAWDASRGADVLVTRERDGGALQLYFRGADAQRALIAAVRTGPDGARLWQTAYDEWETVGGVRLPGRVRFAEHNDSFDDGVESLVQGPHLEPASPDRRVHPGPPSGVAVRDVGCGG